jgi:hypothetical protein
MEHNVIHFLKYIVEGFISGRLKFSRLQHIYSVRVDSSPFLHHYDCEKAKYSRTSLTAYIKDLPSTIRKFPVLNTYSYYGFPYFRMQCLDLIKDTDDIAVFSKHDFELFKLCNFNEYKSLKHTIDVILDRIRDQICSFVTRKLRLCQLVYDYQIKDWLIVLQFIAFLKHDAQEFVLSKCRDIDETISNAFKEKRRGKIYPKLSIEHIVQQYYADNYFHWNEERVAIVQPKRRRVSKRR